MSKTKKARLKPLKTSHSITTRNRIESLNCELLTDEEWAEIRGHPELVRTVRFAAGELRKVGMTIVEHRRCRLRCLKCGNVRESRRMENGRAPRDYWVCPNGCNRGIDGLRFVIERIGDSTSYVYECLDCGEYIKPFTGPKEPGPWWHCPKGCNVIDNAAGEIPLSSP